VARVIALRGYEIEEQRETCRGAEVSRVLIRRFDVRTDLRVTGDDDISSLAEQLASLAGKKVRISGEEP
jgi:hypothetical protein